MDSGLIKFAIRRIAWALPVILLVTLFVFSLVHFMPGSPEETMLPPEQRTPENVEDMRDKYNLDAPPHEQYIRWVTNMATGDMGTSYLYDRPVSEVVTLGIGRTLQMAFLGAVISIIVAVPLGVVSAVYKDTWVDNLSRVISLGGISIPQFWLGLMMILVLARLWNGWFGYTVIPSGGFVSLSEGVVPWFRHIIAPALVLGVPYGAIIARITRSSMVEILNEEYITTARSKGVKEKSIIGLHGFRNALIPIITVAGYQVGSLFNGSVVVEMVFSFPGIGWYIYRSTLDQDMPVLMAGIMFVVIVYLVINFLADVSYALIDPRIDYRSQQ